MGSIAGFQTSEVSNTTESIAGKPKGSLALAGTNCARPRLDAVWYLQSSRRGARLARDCGPQPLC